MSRDPAHAAARLRVMTWNIHSCIDHRGRYTPERTARVIRWLHPDIIALQEANLVDDPGRDRLLRALRPEFPHWLFAPTHERGCVHRPDEITGFGNLILSRWPLVADDRLELSHGAREPRLALRARLSTPAGILHCWVVHLGLGLVERREQGRRLAEALENLPADEPLILAGDFNEWLPRARSLRDLHRQLIRLPPRRSFPASRPLLPLDQIWIRGPLHPHRLKAVRDPILSRISDHLPVVADLTLEAV
ncbi:MAG: endonuclease/exonuclease/phosphatase family protein [Guyparkeria sp.]|uniref:endonuclease/exonuclease/phosphatase family protein n=1 Tax=Guyparkeria sp. TaxID=2035736 RepID=UPI003978AA9D